MTNDSQSQEKAYSEFKNKLQQVFDEKFQSEQKRRYFDAFFTISNACHEFRKELLLLDEPLQQDQVKNLMGSKFDLAKHEIYTQATQFFNEKGV
ncbi:hypothetical protein [Enterococcus sp. DIV1420a]|uniref:hypothetical protein n=1 Tax=Enterococcus sp. DIV1420a TaxID=2774672 RepID=UPI0012837B60|nr:hypothetical protein [Listeria monocytogenes]